MTTLSATARDPAQADARPVLTGTIIKAQYCRGRAGDDGIRLSIKWSLRNDTPLTWLIYDAVPEIAAVALAENAEKLAAGVYASYQDGTAIYYAEQPGPKKSAFRLLSPRGQIALTTPSSTGIMIAGPPGALGDTQGLPGPGDYVMRVTADIWPFNESEASRWTQEFISKGTLWTDTLKSEPIKLRVPPRSAFEKCS